MQITLPDHPQLASKAASAGFATVEDYVRHLIEEDAGPLDAEQPPETKLPYGQWRRRFQEFLAQLEPGNPHVDDSRESIYPVR